MDYKLERLMKQLGEAINDSVSDSELIADIISRIKSSGYDVCRPGEQPSASIVARRQNLSLPPPPPERSRMVHQFPGRAISQVA